MNTLDLAAVLGEIQRNEVVLEWYACCTKITSFDSFFTLRFVVWGNIVGVPLRRM